MKRITTLNTVLLLLFLLPAINMQGQSVTANWGQFRGADRSGITSKYDLPEQAPTLLWKKDLGAGFSEIVVEGNTFYTMFSEELDTTSGWEYLAAFEVETGKELWRVQVDSLFFDQFGDGPRSTPALGEKYIFCLSSYGTLAAYKKENGEKVWSRNLRSEFGSTVPRWGFSSSPVLVDNTLVAELGGTELRAFAGFDKNSGELIWSNGQGMASYNSPLVANIEGMEQIIFANGQHLYAIDAKGDSLWTFQMKTNSPTAMPVFFENNRLFLSDLRSGFSIVEVKGNEVKEALSGRSMKTDYSSCLYHEGHIYGFNVAALQCISAENGEKQWVKRGLGKGSLIMVGDQLLVLSDKGKLVQVKAVADKYTEVTAFQAIEGKSWTAPSFSDGKLFVRNLSEMACYSYEK